MMNPFLRVRLFSVSLVLLLLSSTGYSATVTISGSVLLEGESSHGSVKVLFERIAPTSLRDSVLTGVSGSFSKTLETGVYTITYSKTGYFPVTVASKALYETTTLATVTLLKRTTRINVPATFATIQAAINAASTGDTVLVAPGTYIENISFKGKNITVASQFLTTADKTKITGTVIDGGQNGHVVDFSGGEGNTALLDGFTITNGKPSGAYPHNCGGGVLIYESSPTIRNVIITNNTTDDGAGIYCRVSSAMLENLLLTGNHGLTAGGISFDACAKFTDPRPRLLNSTVEGNEGNGVALLNSRVEIINCIITNNSRFGVENVNGDAPTILNSLLFGNTSGNLYHCGDLLGQIITKNANNTPCDAYYNIFVDPQFVNKAAGDYHLGSFSPGIGAGFSDSATLKDIEGLTRGTLPDIGAYENPLLSPPRAPVFDTKALADATEGSAYSLLLTVTDLDQPDTLTFELIRAPSWMSINSNHCLVGTPRDADTGTGFPVVVRVIDSYDFADTLSTTITVINVNNAPVIQTISLKETVAGLAYADTILATDDDIHDTIMFELVEGPAWMTVTSEGFVYGNPVLEDIGAGQTVIIAASDNTGLTDLLNTTIDVVRRNNIRAAIKLDTNLKKPGCQQNNIIDFPGVDQYIGFAVYVENNESLRSFSVDLTWDPAKASYRASRSGPGIEEDSYRFNGIEDAEFTPEKNILQKENDTITSIVEVSTENRFKVVWAKMGGTASSDTTGLIYQAVFKTTANASATDPFAITVNVSLFDDDGYCVMAEPQTFTVGHSLKPPFDVRFKDVPNDQGHELLIEWSHSPDKEAGLVTYYRIYRSLSPNLYEIRPLTDFTDIDSLIEAESFYTVLLDSVSVVYNYYWDQCVPLPHTPYYYWVQAVGNNGVSEKAAVGAAPVAVSGDEPAVFSLNAPSPNPFNPSTTISFSLPAESMTTLTVYDIAGRAVKTLVSSSLTAGQHRCVWDGTDAEGMKAASGVYFARLEAGALTKTVKMMLMK